VHSKEIEFLKYLMLYKSWLIKYPGYLCYLWPCFRFGKKQAFWSEHQSLLFEISRYRAFIIHHTLCIHEDKNYLVRRFEKSRILWCHNNVFKTRIRLLLSKRRENFIFLQLVMNAWRNNSWEKQMVLRASLAPLSEVFITDHDKTEWNDFSCTRNFPYNEFIWFVFRNFTDNPAGRNIGW